ncbi:hypothetical protein [Streptomyces sp. NPDC005485]|uniref:hypothetical protein n=1 Tax=Streptomyces sp. NPDC005485 TaxID=3155591 RepID=UPI0033B33A33
MPKEQVQRPVPRERDPIIPPEHQPGGAHPIEISIAAPLVEKRHAGFEVRDRPEMPIVVRRTIPWYVNERSVMRKVTARLVGVTTLVDARAATGDLAIKIHEFGAVEGFPAPVAVVGCPLRKGPAPQDLASRIEQLPLPKDHAARVEEQLSSKSAAFAAPVISAEHGDMTAAALQAATAVLGEPEGWETRVARVVLEGFMWFVIPTKPITSVVKLLSDAVRDDEAPQAWADLAQGQFVGAMCHLDPLPIVALG